MTHRPPSARGQALLDAARAAEPRLDDDARRRMRSRIVGAIGAGTVTVTTVTAAGAGTALSTATAALTVKSVALIAVLGLGVGLGVGGGALVAVHGPRSATVNRIERGAGSGAHEATLPAPVILPVPAPPPSAAVASPEDAPRPAPAAPAPRPIAARPRVPATAPRSASPSAADEAFVAELRTVDRARELIAAGDPARAFAELGALPASSPFAEEHAALRIVALCASGRRAEGLDELDRFRASFPRSLQIARADRACSGVTDSSSGGHSRE